VTLRFAARGHAPPVPGGAGPVHYTGGTAFGGPNLPRHTLPNGPPVPQRATGDNAGVKKSLIASRPGRRVPAMGLALAVVALGAGPFAVVVRAHGSVIPPQPDVLSFVFGWKGDPLVWLPAIVAALLWRHGVNSVNRAHPAHRVPRRRTVSWMLGLFAILVALDSGIERYDTALFSDHMVQHMILTLVAPPLLLYAGPITLLLRASSAETRRRWIFPILHSRVVRFLSFPVVSWVLFAAVMWGSHFSPLFDAALENEWLHRFEHFMFLSAALLFWWPVVGPDPSPWRMKPGAKVLYVGLQMPQNTFLAVAVAMSSVPLYSHYVSNIRPWGPTPLEDQQLAGSIMWLGGDMVFIGAVILLVLALMHDDERQTVGEDRRLAVEEAALREREVKLAARRAAEAAEAAGAAAAAGGATGATAAAAAAAGPASVGEGGGSAR
jgi:cytochrome c oxidase assembly factor CtaG